MPLFDAPQTRFPMRWSEFSSDYKLFYIWEVSLFALFFLNTTGIPNALPVSLYVAALFGWFAILLVAAIAQRRRANWHWPGLTLKGSLLALLVTAGMAIFLYVLDQGLLPLNRLGATMFLFALSIGVFNVLHSLRVVHLSDADFQRDCADSNVPIDSTLENEELEPNDPTWKRVVRGIYVVAFVLIWLEGMAFFYVHERYVREGSPRPTPTQTESVNEHGTLVYLTHDEMQINNILSTVMMIGIPAIMLSGFLLHFIAGVRMFSNLPPSDGIFGRRS
jgi:hypothetical protein